MTETQARLQTALERLQTIERGKHYTAEQEREARARLARDLRSIARIVE